MGPLIIPDTTPPSAPASSPMLIGSCEPWMSAGMLQTSTFVVVETAVGHWPSLGYGNGTTAGPTCVLQTSGKPKHCPSCIVAIGNPGMSLPLLGVRLEVLGAGTIRVGLARAPELGPAHFGAGEVRAMQVGASQVGVLELGGGEIRVRQVRVAEICAREIGAAGGGLP